ncbi:hypothetical protein L1987_18336 [Smallanthus sonchifolius]|uniref:Uncharacterized protein n=1 Tax=Smallanthus sonchifolius TaxID=185202 RepID=A0ACB9IZG5_9ASTR|nr:hypothetical protein L1987_18336 [Smallanthus sonchifolius]
MSLLDRFREAVFRLIMISALSRVSNTPTTPSSTSTSTSTFDTQSPLRLSSRSSSKSSPAVTNRHHRSYHHYSTNSHHTEAVADCIEFIKRSANDENRDSIASTTSRSAEIVIPLPVM